MSLDDKLLTVGIVLLVVGPIIGLILWRLWRGEAGFYGFWKSPDEIKAADQAQQRGEGGKGQHRDRR